MTDEDVDGVLDDWSPCRSGTGWFVVGYITDDRKGRFYDGELITTSRLITPGEDLAEGVIAETLNSRYRLGSRATEVSMDAFLYAASLGGSIIGPDGEPIESMTSSGFDHASLLADRVRMRTLKDDIEAFEERVGERVEAVAIGRRREPGDHECRPAVEPVGRDEALLRLEMRRGYDGRVGSRNPPVPIFAWTASWVLFLSGEEGGAGPAWVPRHPVACVPEVNGMDGSS